jgi:hypothetical protein
MKIYLDIDGVLLDTKDRIMGTIGNVAILVIGPLTAFLYRLFI